MALPKYDKSKRRQNFVQLPKGAYVIRILDAKEEPNRSGRGSHLVISFDVAEGEYKDIFLNQYRANTNEDRKWPSDGTYFLTIPDDDTPAFIWTNYNSFFSDLEDSNNGFVFSGDPKALKNKLIGGKFANIQSEYNGQIYDHIRLRWTCVAEDVRSGNPGKMPNDKLIQATAARPAIPTDDFVSVPEGLDDELPFA